MNFNFSISFLKFFLHLFSGSLIFHFWGPPDCALSRNSEGLYHWKMTELFHTAATRCRCWRRVLHLQGCSGACLPFLGTQNNTFLIQCHLLSLFCSSNSNMVSGWLDPEGLPHTGTGCAGTSSPTQPLAVVLSSNYQPGALYLLVGFSLGSLGTSPVNGPSTV